MCGPQLTRHPVDEVGSGQHAEAADGEQREGDGGDNDAGDEAGAEEWGKVAGNLESASQHIAKLRQLRRQNRELAEVDRYGDESASDEERRRDGADDQPA